MLRHSVAVAASIAQAETSGELHRAQHAQRIFAEMRGVNRAQNAVFQIGAPAKRIENFVRQRIAQNRVEREIAPPRRVFERGERIAFDFKTPVAFANFAVAARQRNIEFVANFVRVPHQFINPETFAHAIHAAQSFSKVARNSGAC